MGRLRPIILLFLLGAGAPQGCVPGATRGSARCNPSFPSGMSGRLRTQVLVLYTNELCRWDADYIDQARSFHIRLIQDELAKAAASRPGGPQFDFVAPGQGADLYLTYMVTGRTHGERDYLDEDGRRCIGDTWVYMQADLRRGGLFAFSTAAEQFYSNAYGLRGYVQAAQQTHSFLSNGWTCN